MKIVYITGQIPWGLGETFILEEMLEVKNQGVDLLIIPRNPSKEIFHKEAKELLERTVWLPLIDLRMVAKFFLALLTNVAIWRIFAKIFRNSRNPIILIKNLIVLPKGFLVAEIIRKENINHIHAHWGSTTATMAYFISQFTNIPWSFTLHRWDIKENNMLGEKVKSAQFVRCISEHGKKELFEIVGKNYEEKIRVLYLGVRIPSGIQEFFRNKEIFTIATPANLLEVKGHRYLIDACCILLKQGIGNFQCLFFGEGPLKVELENLIKEKKLTGYVKLVGAIPHEKLMEIYINKEIDLVVLPSINTNCGEHEGIPVSLMEAMSYKIPVVSTNTGGIPELLSDGAGIIVMEKAPKQLAEAILKIMNDEKFASDVSKSGYQRIQKEFSIKKNVRTLSELIRRASLCKTTYR